jgi:hypothetical protein
MRCARLLWVAGSICAAFVGGFVAELTIHTVRPAIAADRPAHAKELRAEQFVLEDSGGKPLGAFVLADGKPALSVNGRNGKDRVLITVNDSGPLIAIDDAQGINRLQVGIRDDQPALQIMDGRGTPRLLLGVNRAGQASLALRDQQGVRLSESVDSDGSALFSLFNPQGASLLTISCRKGDNFTGQHRVYDASGKMVWLAP